MGLGPAACIQAKQTTMQIAKSKELMWDVRLEFGFGGRRRPGNNHDQHRRLGAVGKLLNAPRSGGHKRA